MLLDISTWNWSLILSAGHYLLVPLGLFAWRQVKKYAKKEAADFVQNTVQRVSTDPQFVAALADNVVKKINGTYMYGSEQRKVNESVDSRLHGIENSQKLDQERREEMHKSNLDRFAGIEAAIKRRRI